MARLVNDLLVLARADAGHAKLRREQIDLGEVVVDTVDRLAPLAQQTGRTIKLASLPELTMQGDRTYLMQMLTNIVENALKYGGAVVEIELLCHDKHGQKWAEICVRDDGPGIAKEHLSHLFERFYRVDQSRTHTSNIATGDSLTGTSPAGNGLGLSIAQWIAQAHGGEIQVRSAPGQGSVFGVWLPLEPFNAAQQLQPTVHSPHLKTTFKHKEKTRMSQQMDNGERSYHEPYAGGYQESPGYNSYATGFGAFGAGQKFSGGTRRSPSAGQRLALAIVSLVLWVITLFGVISIAAASRSDPNVGIYILLGMFIFSVLIAVINIVFNRYSGP